MLIRSLALTALALTLGGCATVRNDPLPAGVEEIVWQDMGAYMCGRCDGLKLIARSDGTLIVERSWISPQRREITSRRTRTTTPEQFAAFRGHLEPVRGHPNVDDRTCTDYITDQGGFIVTWRDVGLDQLQFDYGCRSQPAMRDLLATAPNVFGIAWP